MKYFVFIFYNLLAISQLAQAQTSTIASLDSNHIVIGDALRLHIRLDADATIAKVKTSVWDSSGVEILRREATQRQNQDFVLTAFEAGTFTLPRLPVVWETSDGRTDTALTNPLVLTVTALALPDSAQIRPIKDILEEKNNWLDYLPLVATILIFILFVLLLRKIFRKPKKNKIEVQEVVLPKVLPSAVALQKLEMLRQAALWQQGKIAEYHTELSFIVREFLENQHQILALESTSHEILSVLEKEKNITNAYASDLKYFLDTTDLVKFAKLQAPVELHDQLWQVAQTLVAQP